MTNDKLFAYLDRHRDDRGIMAALRCALVPAKQHLAWPILGRFGGLESGHRGRTVQAIAGFYATHPPHNQGPSIASDAGDLCWRLLDDEERRSLADADGAGPITRRFQHLLAAGSDEVCDRMLRFVLRAKADGIGIEYRALYADLLLWDIDADRVRVKWARSFWARSAAPEDAT